VWRGFRSALVAGVVAAAVSVWWFVRDLAVYGWPDLFGLLRHGQVVVGQPRTGAVTQATVDYFANTLFRSFWAQFGWMGILVDSRLYLVLRLLSLLAAIGLLLLAARLLTHRQGIGASDLLPLALMVVWPALLLGGLIGYNLTFIQAQGRYMFPSLARIAILFRLGLREVSLPFWRPRALRRLLFAAGINLLSLVRFVFRTSHEDVMASIRHLLKDYSGARRLWLTLNCSAGAADAPADRRLGTARDLRAHGRWQDEGPTGCARSWRAPAGLRLRRRCLERDAARRHAGLDLNRPVGSRRGPTGSSEGC